ncbi:hypothetical protein CKALI_04150 [Corynebacterium kalinowskii]|uniref:SAV-6107-like HEPN domain-containing protein n=1 Tax=Corynebacterium kalinowskii TaxID=2675216 RepID=A0A6B8VF92_9CORY|nr:SAV_6107 family HEPN domain-containing protein [Corynebacterium kalinowskii]QGU01709.1 hypothetical protein CKALI_04150 [Corynebacterium kalinowskii]
MATVVSATTRSISGGQGKRASFISRASILLRDAVLSYSQGELADALEFAYQAALRTAGAYVAGTPVAKRRRKPTGAWGQLALAGPEGKAWSASFAPYSTIRSRLITGLDSAVDSETVTELIELVEHFLDEVETGGQDSPMAA